MAGCSTMDSVGNAADAPGAPTSAPNVATSTPVAQAEPVQTGALPIGVLTFDEPGNRSGGVAGATRKAAELAAQSLSKGSVSLTILSESGGQAKVLAGQLAQARIRILVGGYNAKSVDALARAMQGSTIPAITLAPITDTRLTLYSAALSPRDEATALIGEAKRRGYRRVALAAGADADSAALANVIAVLASEQGMELLRVDGQSAAAFASGMAAARAGGDVDGVIFATDPQMAAALAASADLGGTGIAGNAGWALAEPLPRGLKGAWYPSLPRASLGRFVERFGAAYGETPTLASAVIYDLIILAAALDQMAGPEAFSTRVLQDDLGFAGFTGPFGFGAAGLIHSRQYEIVSAR